MLDPVIITYADEFALSYAKDSQYIAGKCYLLEECAFQKPLVDGTVSEILAITEFLVALSYSRVAVMLGVYRTTL